MTIVNPTAQNFRTRKPYSAFFLKAPVFKSDIRITKPREKIHPLIFFIAALLVVSHDAAGNQITTLDNHQFGVDPQDIWMTLEEILFWREHRSQGTLNDPDSPWVNGIAPLFASAKRSTLPTWDLNEARE